MADGGADPALRLTRLVTAAQVLGSCLLIAGGTCFLLALVLAGDSRATTALYVLPSSIFAGGLWLPIELWRARRAIQEATPAPSGAALGGGRVVMACTVVVAAFTLFAVALALLDVDRLSVVAGIGIGSGAALLVVASTVNRWERRNGYQILVFPRWSFDREMFLRRAQR
jgi:hypothetical protein